MKRSILILLVITGVLIARVAANSAVPPKVMLRAESQVSGTHSVKMKDIATIQASKQVADRIGDIVVTGAPVPGMHKSIELSYVRTLLSAAGIADNIKVVGPASISITGKCVKLSSDKLAEEAKTFILGQLPQGSETYEVTTQRNPRELLLADVGTPEIRPRLYGASVHPGPITVALDIMQGDKFVASTSVVMQIKAVASALVATTTINPGEALNSQNTAWSQCDITRQPQAILSEGGKLQDWVASRAIRSGSVITSTDVTLPPTVRKGDTVNLIVRCGSVTVHVEGQAQDSGKVGDSVRVTCSVSQGNVRARVTGPGMVEING